MICLNLPWNKHRCGFRCEGWV